MTIEEKLENQHQKNIDRGLTIPASKKIDFESCQQCGRIEKYNSNDGTLYICSSCAQWPAIADLGPKAWRKAYATALFLGDERWLKAIEKYQMLVPGSRLNSRDRARDAAAKEKLQEQISPIAKENQDNDISILSGVRDRKSNDDLAGNRKQKRDGLFSEPTSVPSGQSERVEALLSHPLSEELVT